MWLKLGVAALVSPFTYYARERVNGHDELLQKNIPEDFKLRGVVVVSRHGYRTPLRTPSNYHEEWDCGQKLLTLTYIEHPNSDSQDHHLPTNNLYLQKQIQDEQSMLRMYSVDQNIQPLNNSAGTCFHGQLTTHGRHQMENVGKRLRKLYVKGSEESPHRMQFLSPILNREEIYVRSTDTKRTLETAQCILDNLYPTETRPPGEEGILVINSKDKSSENMYARGNCNLLPVLKKAVHATSEYKKHQKRYNKLRETLKAQRFGRSQSSLVGMYNNFECMKGNKMYLPAYFTPEIQQQLKEGAGAESNFSFLTKEICSLSIGLFIGDIMDGINAFMKSPDSAPKFLLFSGHDNTLTPILSGFGILDMQHPPMGSYLVFEFWEDTNNPGEHYVRIIFNGVIKILPGCGNEFCSFTEFSRRAHELIPTNYAEQCQIDPQPTNN